MSPPPITIDLKSNHNQMEGHIKTSNLKMDHLIATLSFPTYWAINARLRQTQEDLKNVMGDIKSDRIYRHISVKLA